MAMTAAGEPSRMPSVSRLRSMISAARCVSTTSCRRLDGRACAPIGCGPPARRGLSRMRLPVAAASGEAPTATTEGLARRS